jgi:hypothetical protein
MKQAMQFAPQAHVHPTLEAMGLSGQHSVHPSAEVDAFQEAKKKTRRQTCGAPAVQASSCLTVPLPSDVSALAPRTRTKCVEPPQAGWQAA